MTIRVSSRADQRWQVEVSDGARTTHDVGVPAGYVEKLGIAEFPPERVIEESFRFLLERESNTSILGRFDLPVIARYFPEYEREIGKRVKG